MKETEKFVFEWIVAIILYTALGLAVGISIGEDTSHEKVMDLNMEIWTLQIENSFLRHKHSMD